MRADIRMNHAKALQGADLHTNRFSAGLGYVLTQQSKKRWIVNTVRKNGWFDAQRHPRIKAWCQRQVEVKMGPGYDFDVRGWSFTMQPQVQID